MIRSVWSTAAAIRPGESTTADAVSATLTRIAELDPALKTFTVVTAQAAKRCARLITDRH
jgi:Asp-tRNA(Asn)/Glu-tRNA(Gln) amidotransferase A subunit family amidase